jgi:F0F1-type ATP synthase gamma subunit
MSNTTADLRRKINSAGDLQSVVRTMKALAASSIGQYEQSVRALADYYRTVELGLGVCFRGTGSEALMTGETRQTDVGAIGAVVFGSDQGLVGQFNDVVADHAVKTLAALPAKSEVWAVGERVHARLADAGLPLVGLFTVPNSVKAITPLVGQILVESETRHSQGEVTELYLFYNRPTSGAVYAPVSQRLLPLDENGDASWPNSPGQPEACPRSWVAAPRPCGRSSANIFSCRSSGRAPNPSRARTRAAWRRCNAPRKTSTNWWRTSTGHSIVCARVASTRNCSTSSPASKR